MKKVGIVLLIAAVCIVGLVASRNMIAQTAVSGAVKVITGLTLEIKELTVGIRKSVIRIADLKLYNPPAYRDRVMVDLPEVYLDYDLGAFLTKKIHIRELRLALSEFVVIKNQDGTLNLDALKVARQEKEKEKKSSGDTPRKKAVMPQMQIDLLALKIGTVVYKDYTRGEEPRVREFKINLDERYENITDPNKLVALIMMKAFANTAIAGILDFDLKGLTQDVSAVVGDSVDAAKEAAGAAVSTGKDVGEAAVETTKEAVESTTNAIKDLLPFGK